jgi:hypothetical protein
MAVCSEPPGLPRKSQNQALEFRSSFQAFFNFPLGGFGEILNANVAGLGAHVDGHGHAVAGITSLATVKSSRSSMPSRCTEI